MILGFSTLYHRDFHSSLAAPGTSGFEAAMEAVAEDSHATPCYTLAWRACHGDDRHVFFFCQFLNTQIVQVFSSAQMSRWKWWNCRRWLQRNLLSGFQAQYGRLEGELGLGQQHRRQFHRFPPEIHERSWIWSLPG